jgi:hypothetical protein
MDEPTRRAWSKPELIVIVRGKPEEAVLQTCKTWGEVGSDVDFSACTANEFVCDPECYEDVAS